MLASYGGARVTSSLRLRADKGEAKTRFGHIIGTHERIKAYTNREQGSLPDDDEMVAFGGELFETLLQGDVRRLYDEARTRQRRRRLDFVLTSMIPWISEKPWEFAYDTGRAELPGHRGDPFRPQRPDQRAGRSDRAPARAAAHPGGRGAAGRLRAAVDRPGGRGDPPRLRSR